MLLKNRCNHSNDTPHTSYCEKLVSSLTVNTQSKALRKSMLATNTPCLLHTMRVQSLSVANRLVNGECPGMTHERGHVSPHIVNSDKRTEPLK